MHGLGNYRKELHGLGRYAMTVGVLSQTGKPRTPPYKHSLSVLILLHSFVLFGVVA